MECMRGLKGYLGDSWIVLGADMACNDADTQAEKESEENMGRDPCGVVRKEVGKVRSEYRDYVCRISNVINGMDKEPSVVLSDRSNHIHAILTEESIRHFREQEICIDFVKMVGDLIRIRRSRFLYDLANGGFVLIIDLFTYLGSDSAGLSPRMAETQDVNKTREVQEQGKRIRKELEMYAKGQLAPQSIGDKTISEDYTRLATAISDSQLAYDLEDGHSMVYDLEDGHAMDADLFSDQELVFEDPMGGSFLGDFNTSNINPEAERSPIKEAQILVNGQGKAPLEAAEIVEDRNEAECSGQMGPCTEEGSNALGSSVEEMGDHEISEMLATFRPKSIRRISEFLSKKGQTSQ